jgi:gamma-glutamylaminecyclotransferase
MAQKHMTRPREHEPRTRVFVYGTLLAGEGSHHLLEHARRVGEACTHPEFTLYDLGLYPGLVHGGHSAVEGEVYEVDEPTLAALDRLESHPEFYRRTAIRLATGDAVETYLLTAQQVAGHPIIPSGSWRARQATPP